MINTPPLIYTIAPGQQHGTTILTLLGPLILYNLFGFQEELRRVNAPVVILDLEQMPYMDSAGLGLLVNGHVSAANRGCRLLLAGVNARAGALLAMTRVDAVLEVFATVDAAEQAVRAPERQRVPMDEYQVRVERGAVGAADRDRADRVKSLL